MQRFFLRLARSTLTTSVLSRFVSRAMRGRAAVFMLHRFRDPESGVDGHDPDQVRDALAYLRRERYQLLDVEELFRRLERGERLERAVAFTLDDGYYDQATIAGPVFAEFDCPATTFVTTGFLDRDTWFWWDRAEFALRQTDRRDLTVDGPAGPFRVRWTSDAERAAELARFTVWCKQLKDPDKVSAIARLAAAAQVELPAVAPPRYAPMTWDQARQCETVGMRFGPHTVSHPLLSRTDHEQSAREIGQSWDRLRAEVTRPSAVFCYPNGQAGDFGARELATLNRVGIPYAVVGSPGYVRASLVSHPDRRYRLPRFNWPRERREVVQYASGAAGLRDAWRGAA